MQVDVNRFGGWKTMALVMLATEGVPGPFDSRQLEGYPQARGAFDMADCRRNPGHGRYPTPVAMVLGLYRESDGASKVSGLVPGLKIDPLRASIHMGP